MHLLTQYNSICYTKSAFIPDCKIGYAEKKNPTIYDVANFSGINISTVSRLLNNPEKVNSEIGALVLEAIDKLEFIPKAEARALSSTDRIVEILLARIADPGRPPQYVNLPLTLIERRTT